MTKTADTNDGACDVDCSLREAITAANGTAEQDTIVFASPVFDTDTTIALTGGQFDITSDMTIDGPNDAILTLDAGKVSRVFNVTAGVVQMDDLVMANGLGGLDPATHLPVGGCIRNLASLSLSRCVVMGGYARYGGGIFNDDFGNLYLANCTIVRNSIFTTDQYGPSRGGGIYNNSNGKAELKNCTIADNQARSSNATALGQGGGIYNDGTMVLRDNIIATNSALPMDSNPNHRGTNDIGGKFNSRGYNLFGSIGSSDEASGWDFYDLLSADPGFEIGSNGHPLLKDNGGGTLTIAVLPTGSAYNRGYSELLEDQRGYPRPNGSGFNIGAYETNEVPVLESLNLSPEAPKIDQNIVATAVAKDPDGDVPTLTVSYVWTRTRNGETITLPISTNEVPGSSGFFARGDIVTVTATANDGVQDSAPRSASVTVANSPIAITSFTLQPKSPYTFEKMIATVKTSDADKTHATYTYIWTKNGVVTKQETNVTNNQSFYDLNQKGYGDKNDEIGVTVEVSDGESSANASGKAIIRNSVPVLSQLTLAPQSPTVGQVIRSTYGGRDADGDALTKLYTWKIGTKLLAGEKGSSLNLAKYAAVKAGDVVSLEMRLSDGTALSKTLKSSVTVVAASTPPALPAPIVSGSANSS